jgi:ubiquitin C-terminal hydrolase
MPQLNSDCGHCQDHINTFIFWQLLSPTTHSTALEECIETWQKTDRLTRDNGLFCQTCYQTIDCTQEAVVFRFAEVIIVMLKRFNGSGTHGPRNNMVVSYPLEFSSGLFAVEDTGIYDLIGIAYYAGTATFGHYTWIGLYCIVRDFTDHNQWYHISDSCVTLTSMNNS